MIDKTQTKSISISFASAMLDTQLSAKATGYLAVILFSPKFPGMDLERLAESKLDGKTAAASALKELEEFGYVQRINERINGKFCTKYLATFQR